MEYQAQAIAVSGLGLRERQEMAALYLRHYDGSDASRFLADLAEKDEAILVRADGTIVGFTTFVVYERTWQGREVRIVFSGDTVVDRGHWGQQALAFAWIARMGEIRRRSPEMPLYWFLIVKGHRTYKYLPAFGKSFHPHWSDDRPDLAALADFLARERFGADYNPATGVVEYAASRGHLKPEYAYPAEEELNKTAVRFFLERNPGYPRGHELVCLCELAEDNMKPRTRRIFLSGHG